MLKKLKKNKRPKVKSTNDVKQAIDELMSVLINFDLEVDRLKEWERDLIKREKLL